MDSPGDEFDFKSPELRRLEKSLEDALASELEDFNNEFERYGRESDQTNLSILLDLEEDLKTAEDASSTVKTLMEKAERPGSGVKSLASMFEQQFSPYPKSPATHRHRAPGRIPAATLSLHKIALDKSDELSIRGVTQVAVLEYVDASDDTPAQRTAESNRSSLTDLPPPPEPNIQLRHSPRNRYTNRHDSDKLGAQKTDSLLTPIKTKEALTEKWMGINAKRRSHTDDRSAKTTNFINPQLKKNTFDTSPGEEEEVKTQFVDDETIKRRRADLVQGLKVHLRENLPAVQEFDRTEQPECTDEGKTSEPNNDAFDIFLDNGIENGSTIMSPDAFTSSTDSVNHFDSIILNDNGILRPIHEQSNEISNEVSTASLQRNDSSDSTWMLPIVNDFHDKKRKSQTLCSRLRYFRSHFCNQAIGCIESIGSQLKDIAKELAIFLSTCIWWIYTKCRLATTAFLTGLKNVVMLIANMCHNGTMRSRSYIIQCYEDWSAIIRILPDGVNKLMCWMTAMDKGTAACLASFHICMITEMSGAAPRYNASLAFVLYCFQVKPVESKRQSILLIASVLLSICIDFDWLSSRYVPDPLESENEGNVFAYRIKQEESLLQAFTWYGTLVNTFLKTVCLNFALGSSERGSLIRFVVLERLKVFCISSRPPDDVSKATRSKLVAILWMELVAAVTCFACFFFIYRKGAASTVLFDDGPKQILSLQATLLYKGTSGILVILSLAHHISFRDFCMQFGCGNCCGFCFDNRHAQHRENRRITSTLRKSKNCIVLMKLTDFIVGTFVWINLSSAHKDLTRDAPKDTIVLFALIVSAQIITTVVSTGLGFVVAWWIWLYTKRPSRESRNSALDDTPTSQRGSKTPNQMAIPPRGQTDDTRGRSYQTPRINDKESYDLQHNISTSQSLFESRISAASTPSFPSPMPSPAAASVHLDDAPYCSSREFKSQWANLARGTLVSCKMEKTAPSLSDCHKHFQSRRFYVMASGVVGSETTKLFLLAQRRTTQTSNRSTHSSPKGLVTRCLCEIAFDSIRNQMTAEVRCEDKRQIPFFVSALGLKDLI